MITCSAFACLPCQACWSKGQQTSNGQYRTYVNNMMEFNGITIVMSTQVWSTAVFLPTILLVPLWTFAFCYVVKAGFLTEIV